MKGEIKNIRLKFQCPANWDEMTPMAGGRFCDHCAKIVYDFTNTKQAYFQRIITKNGGQLCGRFRPEQLAPAPVILPWWKQWLSAAALAIGTSFFTQCRQDMIEKTPATNFETAEAIDEKPGTAATDNAVFGMFIDEEPSFPGGIEKFYQFLQKNIRYTPGMAKGRVFLTFRIEKDGSLTNIKILRGVNKQTDAEAVRLIKMSPKWKPGQQNGRALVQQYTAPILFQ